MEYKITTHNENETTLLAQNFESEKFPNMVICLNGDLGSGKTVFAKGFASALGIDETITSPTFTIVKEYYGGEMPFFHMDVYRLDEGNVEINFDEYFVKKGVTIIEWADLVKEELPEERLDISIKIIDEDKRLFVIRPIGRIYEELCEAVL
ncbi:MAG: tRNA (adenosine(37)-N6)-threonylcarbamoyltransferase complex ATPase subunit type 1 TsaE [bacterium]|nr:tRNA (adenosine(37)-N6)-threonylcarbamoyltransferase complex ATPase subunit type 1 TsaE [bacterium]